MRKFHNKLVRDRIPDIVRQAHHNCEFVTLSPSQYIEALRQKLIEEATEAATACSDDELIEELADLYEVIDALLKTTEIQKQTVLNTQAQRRQTRGGFEGKIQLVWTEAQS